MTLDAATPEPVTDDRYKWLAFGAVGSFFVTGVLSLTMVFVALPAIAEDFDVTLKTASWVVIANSLTISALLLPFGRLSDLIGRRRVHLAGLILFAAGSVFTALAGSFTVLLVARVAAAIGGALTESVGTGILVSVFPDHERGKAIGSQTTSVAVGAAAGPLAAGIALEFFSWRALFMVVAAMTVVTYVIGHLVLDERRISRSQPARRPFDVVGAAGSTVLVVLLVVVLNNPFGLSWTSLPVLLGIVGLVVGLYAFVRWELARADPMLQLHRQRRPRQTERVVEHHHQQHQEH
ncbi:MAG: MFS transporter, partial [Actinomycetota bacterium]